MFGYVTVNQPELTFREFDWYHSFYCGLCRQLRKEYGLRGQLTLTYDMTFLIILLTGLYETETPLGEVRCTTHPLTRHPVRSNEFTGYAADMNVLLAYYQSLDDWRDDKSLPKGAMAQVLWPAFLRVRERYPQKTERIVAAMSRLSESEAQKSAELDRAAGLFGEITAEIFARCEDEWERELRTMGFYLGKFIYLMDACEDLERDIRRGSYNPFLLQERFCGATAETDFLPLVQEECEPLLTMMMAECSRAFERLPVLEGAGVLRNILYSGVWTRYEMANLRRKDSKKNVGSL